MPEKRSANLGEEGLHQIEPGPMLGRVDILKPVGTSRQVGPSLLGDMGRMVAQNDPDPGMRRIVGVQILEKGDEFLAPMPFLDPGDDLAGGEIQGGQDRGRSQSDIFVVPRHGRMLSGNGRPVGGRQPQGLDSLLLVQADRVDRVVEIRRSRIQEDLPIDEQNFPHLGVEVRIPPFQVVSDRVRLQVLLGKNALDGGLGRPVQRRGWQRV